jgi:hypothetical protein
VCRKKFYQILAVATDASTSTVKKVGVVAFISDFAGAMCYLAVLHSRHIGSWR